MPDPYTPETVIQGDGSILQWLNCNCAVGAQCLDRDTRGAKTSTGGAVRWCTGDHSGGTTLDQVDYGLRHCFPPDDHLDVRRMMPILDAVQEIADGRGANVSGGYRPISGTWLDGSPGFTGNHAWYWNAVKVVMTVVGGKPRINTYRTEVQIFDPLWDGRRAGIPSRRYRWISLDILIGFCSALTIDDNGRTVPDGYCYIAFTRNTELDPNPVVMPIDYGDNPMITQSGLTITSSHVMALAKGQALRSSPSNTGKVVTHMAKAGKVAYHGIAASGWRAVRVQTGNFPDGKLRPVVLYVPAAAGVVSAKEAA